MKLTKLLSVVALLAFMLSLAIVVSARGAPEKQKAFTAQAIVSVDVSPIVASVPPMTAGYDVICNLSTAESRDLSIARTFSPDTSEWLRLRTPVDWRSYNANGSYSVRSGPLPATVLRT